MSENSRGCWASARAKVLPALTSARSAATRWRWRSSSASSARAVSARSSGRPEPTSPASWRVQMASAVALNTGRVNRRWPVAPVPVLAWSPTNSTAKGTNAWARNWLRAALAVSASTTPLRVRPWSSRASKLKAGMG
jgi:hypothetical protein